MKIKKFFSLLMTVMFVLNNWFSSGCAIGSDSESDSEDSLSDIVSPEIHDNDDWQERLRRVNDIVIHELTPPSDVDWNKKIKELNEHLTSTNARIIEMRHISEENQEELSRLNKMICDLTRERDDSKIKIELAKHELQEWKNDELCADCVCCNPIGARIPILSGTVNNTPSFSIFRSKRFYKGVAIGSILVAMILIGGYLLVYLIG